MATNSKYLPFGIHHSTTWGHTQHLINLRVHGANITKFQIKHLRAVGFIVRPNAKGTMVLLTHLTTDRVKHNQAASMYFDLFPSKLEKQRIKDAMCDLTMQHLKADLPF